MKELFEKKIERNNNLFKLFESMIKAYRLTNKVNNYQIRQSILNAYSVNDIFNIEEKYIRNSFIIENKNLNKIITDFTDRNY